MTGLSQAVCVAANLFFAAMPVWILVSERSPTSFLLLYGLLCLGAFAVADRSPAAAAQVRWLRKGLWNVMVLLAVGMPLLLAASISLTASDLTVLGATIRAKSIASGFGLAGVAAPACAMLLAVWRGFKGLRHAVRRTAIPNPDGVF